MPEHHRSCGCCMPCCCVTARGLPILALLCALRCLLCCACCDPCRHAAPGGSRGKKEAQAVAH